MTTQTSIEQTTTHTNATEQNEWDILLYYLYTPIENAPKFAYDHLKFCKSLGLKGRILVADEGINGTVGGPPEITQQYIEAMHNDPRFQKTVFKISKGPSTTFRKMFVRYRPELVTLAIDEKIDPNTEGGIYLKPEELKEMYDKNEDFVIIDMRNKYEAEIGRFQNAIVLEMKNFKELPELVKGLENYKDKKVVTYCTGGIRCEKASALLKKRGFNNVYQLEGGIVKYGEKFPDNYWEGKLFVFDGRMAVPINSAGKEKILAQCLHCQTPCDTYINCTNYDCNKLIVMCNNCRTEWQEGCSIECSKKPRPKQA